MSYFPLHLSCRIILNQHQFDYMDEGMCGFTWILRWRGNIEVQNTYRVLFRDQTVTAVWCKLFYYNKIQTIYINKKCLKDSLKLLLSLAIFGISIKGNMGLEPKGKWWRQWVTIEQRVDKRSISIILSGFFPNLITRERSNMHVLASYWPPTTAYNNLPTMFSHNVFLI